jgi:hypothetical protein
MNRRHALLWILYGGGDGNPGLSLSIHCHTYDSILPMVKWHFNSICSIRGVCFNTTYPSPDEVFMVLISLSLSRLQTRMHSCNEWWRQWARRNGANNDAMTDFIGQNDTIPHHDASKHSNEQKIAKHLQFVGSTIVAWKLWPDYPSHR